jgi:hypothetical protein
MLYLKDERTSSLLLKSMKWRKKLVDKTIRSRGFTLSWLCTRVCRLIPLHSSEPSAPPSSHPWPASPRTPPRHLAPHLPRFLAQNPNKHSWPAAAPSATRVRRPSATPSTATVSRTPFQRRAGLSSSSSRLASMPPNNEVEGDVAPPLHGSSCRRHRP